MGEDQDAVLVHACLEGDPDAFRALVERYSGPLYSVAYRITHDSEDAADATQAAFLKAYQKLHTFDFSHRFFSWVYRIAINEAVDLANGRKRRKKLEGYEPPLAMDPEAGRAEVEKGEVLQQALRELTPDARALIALKYLRELSYADMAEVLGIPEKTVKSRLHSARQKLLAVMVQRGFVG